MHHTGGDLQLDQSRFVYLDHNATTPVDPRVFEEMLPYFQELYANPSSHHSAGSRAADAVRKAREQVASLIEAAPTEITFTSGATESINTVLRAMTIDAPDSPGHLAVASTEHPAVLETARYLQSKGCKVDFLGVHADGTLRLEELEKSLANGARIASVMAANNETGVVHPLEEIHLVCDRYGARFHCDATQIVGKLPFSVDEYGVDFAAMSAHKIYGPKGVGALFIRHQDRDAFPPLIHGGGQEQGVRSGTSNVPGIVGFGAAAALAKQLLASEGLRLGRLKELLLSLCFQLPSPVSVNGDNAATLPGTLSLTFEGVDAEALLARLPDVALSTGSACASSEPGPSPVLLAMGQSRDAAGSGVRFSLGRFNSEDDVRYVVSRLGVELGALAGLRA